MSKMPSPNSMLIQFRRTITKVIGGGDGGFLTRMNFFFYLSTVQVGFLTATLCTNFFFCLVPYSPVPGAFALGLYAVIFLRLVARSRESDSKVLTLIPAPRSLRDSGIQTWPAHFSCAFCKRLWTQDAGPLQDLRVWDFIQPPDAEESTPGDSSRRVF